MTEATTETRMDIPINPCRPHGESGFSLVEVIIASLIMLLVALAIIPLFTMAASSNLQGASSTSAANYARDRLELLWQLPFNDSRLTITAGTVVRSYEYFDASATSTSTPPPTPGWTSACAPPPPSGRWRPSGAASPPCGSSTSTT
jgi:Tfp pilus assembly protein PilV